MIPCHVPFVTTAPPDFVKFAGPYLITDWHEMEMMNAAIKGLGKIEHAIVRVWGTHFWIYRSAKGLRRAAQ